MRIFAVLPILTALLAAWCALWPTARRFVWPVVALAAVNVVLTPLTSGEWFYQREEDAAYEQAVVTGDFSAFERLVDQHDPHLLPRMVAVSVVLLISLVGLAVLQVREGKGKPARASSHIVTGAVVLAGLATLVEAGLRLAG